MSARYILQEGSALLKKKHHRQSGEPERGLYSPHDVGLSGEGWLRDAQQSTQERGFGVTGSRRSAVLQNEARYGLPPPRAVGSEGEEGRD